MNTDRTAADDDCRELREAAWRVVIAEYQWLSTAETQWRLIHAIADLRAVLERTEPSRPGTRR
jgi:hypothetical protein